MKHSPFGVSICIVLATTVARPAEPDGPPIPPGLGTENVPIAFTTGNGWAYDGRIELPPEDRRNGWAVMLLGGGLGSTIDWEVPGVLTIDGEPTHDADTIARALLDAGFVVMRWHSIRRGDPRRARDPLMMEAPRPAQTVEQARKALKAFLAENVVAADRTFLLGHSLGARRAAVLTAEHPMIAGMVTLAGAGLIPSELGTVRSIVAAAEAGFARVDVNADGAISKDEWPPGDTTRVETESSQARPFDLSDANRNDKLDRHEWAVLRLLERAAEWAKPIVGARDRFGHPWAVEVLADHKTPTLLLVGASDERWLIESYLVTVHMKQAGHPDYAWRVFDKLGHQLGPEVPGDVEHPDYGVIAEARNGPIDRRVVSAIIDWLGARAK